MEVPAAILVYHPANSLQEVKEPAVVGRYGDTSYQAALEFSQVGVSVQLCPGSCWPDLTASTGALPVVVPMTGSGRFLRPRFRGWAMVPDRRPFSAARFTYSHAVYNPFNHLACLEREAPEAGQLLCLRGAAPLETPDC